MVYSPTVSRPRKGDSTPPRLVLKEHDILYLLVSNLQSIVCFMTDVDEMRDDMLTNSGYVTSAMLSSLSFPSTLH